MRVLRARLPRMGLAAVLGAALLPPVPMAGNAVYGAAPALAMPPDAVVAAPAAALPLFAPVSRSARCPASSLPPRVARACAAAVARLEALAAAAAALPERRELRMGVPDAADRRALVARLCTAEVRVAGEADGENASAAVTLQARPDAAAEMAGLLRNPELLALQRQLLEEYEALLRKTLAEAGRVEDAGRGVPPGTGGTWYRGRVTPSGQEANPPLSSATARDGESDVPAARLEAAVAVQDALQASPEGWLARADALSALERAATLLPESGVVRLLLAEAQLQGGLPQRSADSCTEALRLSPSLGRARYVRALAHWRLQQLALAEDDLSASLDGRQGEAPQGKVRAVRLRARGAVRMLRRDAAGMCADFLEACALGDCEGLALARERQQCPKTGGKGR
ncbi:translation initiation factor IF-2 [uncultured Desulfovibrio sp.]|uniref:tetratricopeptide repeat protein n=1 Tax=uncultured Desulfovibrio sp. TaxID=167968 RepID=UPI00262C2392|nr:translation initiation factor IF-2 [uncultured Desulfovibrio sp.]